MKIIKNQKNFKVNALMEADQSSDLLDAFFETFTDILNDSDIKRINTSYSYLSSARDVNIKQDPAKDFKMILAEFDDAGWERDALAKLFAKYGDQIAEDYNNDRTQLNQSGMVDYFLFKMTKGKAILMGYTTQDIGYGDLPGDEAFFKFYYGYNKTPYGKLAMEQHFGSLDAYYDYLGEHFADYLKKGAQSELIMGHESFIEAIEGMGIEDLQQHYSYDKSSNIGTLDLKAAGVDIDSEDTVRQRKGMPMNMVAADGTRSIDPDYEIVSPANMLELTQEFIGGMGFELKGVNDSADMGSGGTATINEGVVKLYFDGNHA